MRKNTNDEFLSWWRSLTTGQQAAYARKIWDAAEGNHEVVAALVRGKLRIKFEDAVAKLVDSNGRGITPAGFNSRIVNANAGFKFVQPAINHGRILARLHRFFPGLSFLEEAEFLAKIVAIEKAVQGNAQTRNLLRGVWQPICLPHCPVVDYGQTLEEVFISALERAYCEQFPNRKFSNYRKGELAGQVTIADGTRHERTIAAMQAGPVAALWFPSPFQGFSIPADREIIRLFPKNYCLTGAIDTTVGIVADTVTFAGDYIVPVMDCAANAWQSPERSMCFCSGGNCFGYGGRDLGPVEDYSGGMLVLG